LLQVHYFHCAQRHWDKLNRDAVRETRVRAPHYQFVFFS